MTGRPKNPHLPVPASLGKGRYYLKHPVGMGGMAAVYRAWDTWEKAEVAIKVLMPHAARSDKSRSRFHKEVRTMSQLDHPNIVSIFGIGEEQGYNYSVMELCRGGNLVGFLKRGGRMTAARALKIIVQVLQGLEYAHIAGVVHRDIKPHNMLFLTKEHRRVKLTDFGIARVMRSHSARITATGDTLGTMAYMAPEQRRDARSVGPRADLYAVGATLYLLVTGRRPIELTVSNKDPAVLDRLPRSVRGFVSRATEIQPDHRFQDARSMYQEALRILDTVDDDDSLTVPLLPPEFDPEEDTTIIQVQDEPVPR